MVTGALHAIQAALSWGGLVPSGLILTSQILWFINPASPATNTKESRDA